jgi:hypothetical protein
MHTLAQLAETRRETVTGLREQIERNASACFGL